MVRAAMAKKKKPSTPAAAAGAQAAPAGAAALLDFEQRFEAGDASGARRLALAALQASATGDTADRARALLKKADLDGPPFVVFGALLLVLTVVFFTLIVGRNAQLQNAPPAVDLNKAAIRVAPALPVPASEPGVQDPQPAAQPEPKPVPATP